METAPASAFRSIIAFFALVVLLEGGKILNSGFQLMGLLLKPQPENVMSETQKNAKKNKRENIPTLIRFVGELTRHLRISFLPQ